MIDPDLVMAEIERWFVDHRPSLCLPNGWFGRPRDNQHQLTWSAVRGDSIILELDWLQQLIVMDVGEVVVIDDTLELRDVGYAVLCRRDYASHKPSIIDCGPGAVSFVGGEAG